MNARDTIDVPLTRAEIKALTMLITLWLQAAVTVAERDNLRRVHKPAGFKRILEKLDHTP